MLASHQGPKDHLLTLSISTRDGDAGLFVRSNAGTR